jgi:hypothetical protein
MGLEYVTVVVVSVGSIQGVEIVSFSVSNKNIRVRVPDQPSFVRVEKQLLVPKTISSSGQKYVVVDSLELPDC